MYIRTKKLLTTEIRECFEGIRHVYHQILIHKPPSDAQKTDVARRVKAIVHWTELYQIQSQVTLSLLWKKLFTFNWNYSRKLTNNSTSIEILFITYDTQLFYHQCLCQSLIKRLHEGRKTSSMNDLGHSLDMSGWRPLLPSSSSLTISGKSSSFESFHQTIHNCSRFLIFVNINKTF